MRRILEFLKPLFRLNYKYPFLVLLVSLLLAGVSGIYALKLIKRIDTDIANLLPEDYPSVVALNKLKEQVGGETSMEVAIKSPDFEQGKKFAYALIDSSLKLYDQKRGDFYFKRAEFRRDVAILKNNALYLATNEELDKITTYLKDEIKNAKEEANPFFIDLEDEFDDDDDAKTDEPAKDAELDQFKEAYKEIVPTEYPVNEDSTVLVVKLYPTGSKSDVGYLEDMFEAYDQLLIDMNMAQYHDEIQVQFGGRLKRHLEEVSSIMKDVTSSFASGISSVLLLVMLYFFVKKYTNYRKGAAHDKKYSLFSHIIRAPLPLLIIGLPLVIALSYTFGITYFQYGMLNTMTSVLFVILFGMGIDYGLHFYARYIELRSDGLDVEQALLTTYDSTGQAIVTSALTTASAMYILMIAEFRGFSEFGFISGTGIVLTLFTMVYVLPSLLVISEKLNLILFNKNEEEHQTPIYHKYPFARTIVVLGLLVSALTLAFVHNLKFEYDFGKLNPEFPEYEKYKDFKGQVKESSKRNPAYVLADTDEDVNKVLDQLRFIHETDTTSPTIQSIESIQERFPDTSSEVSTKLDRIANIRQLLQDPFIKGQNDEWLDKLRDASKTTEALDIDQLPKFLTEKFTTKNGELGKFIIIYPNEGLSDGRKSIAFKDDVGTITTKDGAVFHAASTSIVAADMLDLMIEESPYMVAATLIFIVILMFIAFKSWRWTIIALLPLVVGLVFTFGVMLIFNISFNFYNLVVLPAILGIGEDSGVHLAARYREEGRKSMWQVLSSTGQHVTIGSLTTMLGFAGLLFTNHPGLFSIGLMAVLGIGMTLLTSLTFLPALIQVLEDNDWITFD